MVPWDSRSYSIAKPSILENLASFFSTIVTRFPFQTFSGGVLVVFLGGIGIQNINVDVNVANFFKPGTEIRDSMDFMDREMSGTMDLRVRIEADVKDPRILNGIDSLQSFVQENENISVTYSIADVVKQMHRAVMDDSLKYESIPPTREKVNNLFTMYYMSGDQDLSLIHISEPTRPS